MTYTEYDGIKVWGETQQQNAITQMTELIKRGNIHSAALMADHHLGYSQPVGGVVAYRDVISVSGVGVDIACGNKAVRTKLTYGDIKHDIPRLADEIFKDLKFGPGKVNLHPAAQEHPLFDDPRWKLNWEIESLKQMARDQLGTIGGGNHYVDVFAEIDDGIAALPDDAPIWIGVHFGSRGLGFKIAKGYLNLAEGKDFLDKSREKEEPTLLALASSLGEGYFQAMCLAGEYAYAGRDWVCNRVAHILGTGIVEEVHNHHNFAWLEEHGGERVIVVRKGATPLWPGQRSFIGGSMTDVSVIVEGKDTEEAEASLRSTVHGAGRVMGRTEALGKTHKSGRVVREARVTEEMLLKALKNSRVELRGGGLDESPFVYRRLPNVLYSHRASTQVTNILRPIIVCMDAPKNVDPYHRAAQALS